MHRAQGVEPAAPVTVPVAVHHNEIAAPAAGIYGVDETVEPVEVARHGGRTETPARGHHLRPCGKHFLDGIHLFTVVAGVVRLVVAENVGRCAVVAHIGDAGPAFVMVLCDIFAVGPYVDAGIPVVAPCCLQGCVGINSVSGIAFLAGVVPLLHAQGGDGTAEDGGQIDGLVFGVGNEHAAVARTVGTGHEAHHITALEGEAADIVVHGVAAQRHTVAHGILCRLAGTFCTGVDGERLDVTAVWQDDGAAGIDAHHAVGIVDCGTSADTHM